MRTIAAIAKNDEERYMRYKLSTFLFLLLTSAFVTSHPGGVDKNGGHKNKKNGEYHCHRSNCRSIHSKNQKALQEASRENRSFSLIYRRKSWKHWSDFDGDCMNTRHEILQAQADGKVTLSSDGCSVLRGLWNDPFSGKRITKASDLDTDHVIPLKWANDHGGANWSPKIKEAFANDPLNLLAVDDGLNQSKGAKGPNEWMPPNQAFRCEYIDLWDKVLNKYSDLKMKSSEKRVFQKQISACQS